MPQNLFVRALSAAVIALALGITPAQCGETDDLFLELDVNQVADGTAGSWIRAPWGESYVSAIQEGRYGDAVWARYHMDGRAEGGIIAEDNSTVTEELLEDARGYRLATPELFAQVAARYNATSAADEHPELVELIGSVLTEDLATLAARETYSTSCSGDYLALRSNCNTVLEFMSQDQSYTGNVRQLDWAGDCFFRVGPPGSAPGVTWYQAHAVGKLIYNDCQRTKPCCSNYYVSGYSPKNSGHKKLCLSSKSTGCS
ncbi:hypothetical protein BO82DRAFT_358122 [Aspergillus uvarum CBS 121591]|uniref:WD-like domain-containing protein n=1 Tax=Aspergillus uvarum CBS 121591 TaxID=1448315 RepID=A0A319BZT6_9EURO|nr:hypothetical protein BO82DRAFT_358122 [Aspergillus uvarum CBS 121591]PYH77617.1 hypothetical protein BO82DRAFT_358122 [Aspergillus uvarum CBS 121591]